MEIRLFDSQDVTAYRELRLQALIKSPTAFASSYEREVCLSLTILLLDFKPMFVLGATFLELLMTASG